MMHINKIDEITTAGHLQLCWTLNYCVFTNEVQPIFYDDNWRLHIVMDHQKDQKSPESLLVIGKLIVYKIV